MERRWRSASRRPLVHAAGLDARAVGAAAVEVGEIHGQCLLHPVAFGGFVADLEGLTFGETTLPWDHFGKVEIAQGKLSVKPRGKWLPWAVTDFFAVPNPHLLLAVVEEMKSDTASSS